MTRVIFKNTDDVYIVQATGHATGSEKVCAGVSTLMYAIAGWAINSEDTLAYHKSKLDSGSAYVEFSGGEDAKTVYKLAYIGFKQIAEKYPENIKVFEAK